MYHLRVDRQTSENIYMAIEKYLYDYSNTQIEEHFKITQAQMNNIYQQMDVGVYDDFEDMYYGFNTEVGTRREIEISKARYKRVIMMLLAYKAEIITF